MSALPVPTLDPQLRATLDYCVESVALVLDEALKLGHNEGEPQVLALAIYGTVVELFSACVGLAQLNEPTAIPGILRSMYESHVELDNLLHEAGYIEHIYAAGFEQTLKVMESTSLRQAFKDGRKAEYDELSAKLADLKCRGKGPLKIWQRCKRAGRLEEYESLYGLFCLDAHNNMPALAERHISEKPDGGMLIWHLAGAGMLLWASKKAERPVKALVIKAMWAARLQRYRIFFRGMPRHFRITSFALSSSY